MSQPLKVSVIVVVHPQYLNYLPNALNSLKTQSLNHELIIVANGCSVDHPDAIAVSECSLSRAANAGIRQAKGEYIVRLDADDWVDSSLLEEEARILDDTTEIDCVWCDYMTAESHSQGEGFETFLLNQLPQMSLEHACGIMFRKSAWEELGGYDEDLQYQEAFDFWCRFEAYGFKAIRIEKPMYMYRRGHTSMSTNPERDKVRQQLEDKYQK